MDEIAMALNGKVDYLFVATSTCGTVMGCADYIKESGLFTKVIAVDAVGSVLFGGKPNKRLIPGHGAAVPSKFLKPQNLSGFVHVDDLGCIEGCWQLLQEEAIMAGGSSGAIVSAFNTYSDNIPRDSNCVLLVGDSGERYLDTIYNKEWIREHFSGDRLFKLMGQEAWT
jgi:cysteine synthase A